MDNSELIGDFINKLVASDSEGAKLAFSQMCSAKAKSLASDQKVMEKLSTFSSFKTSLMEYDTSDTPLRMEGDKIFVNNKLVGHIKVDISSFDSGIDFVSEDGTFSKEFNTAEDLFAFLSQKYLGESNVK